MASHGIYQFIHESSMVRSDEYKYEIDNEVNNILNKNNAVDVSVVKTPYTFKLLTQEWMTMGIKPNLLTSDIQSESDYDEEVDAAINSSI